MPVIQVKDMQHILKPGQTRLGAGPGVDVSVSDDASLGVQAILDLAADSQVVIRRGRDGAAVRVNGVALGVEPTPLMHGDKLDVNGIEVLFSEDKKIGATHFVSAAEVAAAASKRSGPARATAGTGGRLVSLVDGKEYQVPSAGIVFGREAGSDVVVAQPEVSRRHASIVSTEQGYVLQDLSTNGVWVNGSRVQGSQLLARADVVRVGTEEFRFYADVAQPPPKSGAPTPAQAAPKVPPAGEPSPTAAPIASAPRSAPAAVADSAPAAPASMSASVLPSQAMDVGVASAAGGHPEPVTVPTPPAAAQPASPRQPPVAPAEPTKRVTTIPRAEGASAPSPTGGTARAAKSRPKPVTAPAKLENSGGMPTWLWIIIIIIVGAAAYFIGQGRG
jgi:pSer/pThr/pTyr-binding forkhead associated (FHA) protein